MKLRRGQVRAAAWRSIAACVTLSVVGLGAAPADASTSIVADRAATAAVATPSDGVSTATASITTALTRLARDAVTRPTDQVANPSYPAATVTALQSLPYWGTPSCARCNAGPAAAAAARFLAQDDPADLTRATTSFDRLIAALAQPNGSISPRTQSADIETMFSAATLGETTLALEPYLSSPERATWTSTVTRAADFLIANKNLAWYTNGNIVIGNALVMALAYRLSSDPTYLRAYDTAMRFAIAPDQARWPGYGFFTTVNPTSATGSDGAGYFAEAGAAAPGFDPDYTMLQTEQLARLYAVTNDPMALRLLNMTTNQLLNRTNETTWKFEASNGSRHDYKDPETLDSAALAVLAWTGGRTDLTSKVAGQLSSIQSEYSWVFNQSATASDRFYYAVGMTLPSIVYAGLPAVSQRVAPTTPMHADVTWVPVTAPSSTSVGTVPSSSTSSSASSSAPAAVTLWLQVPQKTAPNKSVQVAVAATTATGASVAHYAFTLCATPLGTTKATCSQHATGAGGTWTTKVRASTVGYHLRASATATTAYSASSAGQDISVQTRVAVKKAAHSRLRVHLNMQVRAKLVIERQTAGQWVKVRALRTDKHGVAQSARLKRGTYRATAPAQDGRTGANSNTVTVAGR